MEFLTQAGSIKIVLPITTPTGKVRVKRPVSGFISEPVAPRRTPIGADDYLEWQISYDTDSLHEPSVLKDVVLNKRGGVRYGCELVRLIVEARRLRLLSKKAFDRLRDVVNSPLEAGVEERERIREEEELDADGPAVIPAEYAFVRRCFRVPVYLKRTDAYSLEITIKAKQRAVGNQAMVYVYLPLDRCCGRDGRPLVGRCAERNEKAEYDLSEENASLISDTVLAFAFASVRHRNDLRMIFEQL